jgi:signal transduction histidine kinase
MAAHSGTPTKEVTQSNITRVLVIGFTLVILFLTVGGTVAFRNIVSIRQNVDTLVRQEHVNRRLIEGLQEEQKTLGAIFYTLTGDPAAARSADIAARLERAEHYLRRIEAEAAPTAAEQPLWNELLRASRAFADEAAVPPGGPSAALRYRELFRCQDEVISAISRLVGAGFQKITQAEDEIDRRVNRFNGQSITLLFASLGLALVCSIFTVTFTRQLFGKMAWQESELARVSWQMLADQESIAQRFSHELHDELGQTLAALRANLTSSAGGALRVEDSIGLTDDAIRSVRQLSQLLRPMILDDFGLDAGLNWLCEGFMQRTGIEVDYQSNHHSRLPDETETQLFRIAQEALTNVARHSGATKAKVELSADGGRIRLAISDNGKGMKETDTTIRSRQGPAAAPAGFGMTGMRARARVAGGVFRVTSPKSGGLKVEAGIPIPAVGAESELRTKDNRGTS